MLDLAARAHDFGIGRLLDRIRDAAEATMGGLVESAPDAIVIVASDGRMVLVNAQVERLFGYRRDELVGQPIELLVPERLRDQHRAHPDGYFVDRVLRSTDVGLELHGRRRDGTEFPVEISLSTLETEDGVLAMSAIRDITDRKQADALFGALLEAAPDAIVTSESGGRIVLVNAQTEQLFGYKREELLGQTVDMLLPERFRAVHDSHRLGYLNDPRARPTGAGLTLFGLRRDGSEFPAEISLSPLETPTGLLVMSAIRDITDRKLAEQTLLLNEQLERRVAERTAELEAANRELEAFSYSVSHDLRAPLRAINGFAQILLEDYAAELDPEPRRYLDLIVSNATHMGQLVDDLLSFARLSRQPIQKQPVDPDDLVRAAIGAHEAECAGRRIEITVGDLPPCQADPRVLRLAFDNLISNALKFTRGRDPAVIEIGWQQLDDIGGAYYVRDNGVGFDMRYAGKL
ncbi:MAG TPA: PAS domain S-box protein, partial [Thermomicrobiales bacterium]|nr:PAS domain S-box protein [Thermomicrobiales bacterium]